MKRLYLVFVLVVLTFSVIKAQQPAGILKGKVVDKSSQEPLPGINILLVGTNLGGATDVNGNFKITNIPVGSYQVRVSAIGYETIIKSDVVINSSRPAVYNFEQQEKVEELEGEVTVTSGYFENSSNEIGSIATFGYEEIRRFPGGFEDVVRALSLVPGVAQATPGRNDLVVRGGAPSENLFLVDGFVVQNINHFGGQGVTGGSLSFVNLDFVSGTEFSTGGFSSVYGDKLSSVLSINLRDGRKDRVGGKATISATQFGLNLEGPLHNNSDFIFSVRRSYLDFIFDAAGFGFVPEYWDGLFKYDYDIDTKNRLSFLFLGAIDRVSFNNDEENIYDNARILASEQNQYVTGVSFKHLMKDSYMTLKLSRNFRDYDSSQRDTLWNPIFLNKSTEAENQAKLDFVFKVFQNIDLNVGASGTLVEFNSDIKLPFYETTFGEELEITDLTVDDNYSKYASYAQFTGKVLNNIDFSAGLRFDYFSAINNSSYFSPRISLSYKFNEITSFNISSGIYYQSPSYLWLAAYEQNKNLDAIRVDQYVAGFERQIRYDTKLKIEAFFKDYSNYPTSLKRPYIVLANTGAGYGGTNDNFSSFGLERLVSEGEGEVKGIELSVQKKSSDNPIYGIFSLTYSKAEFTGLDKITRVGRYDQSWILNLSFGYLMDNWEVSGKFRYSTGTPYTPFNSDGTQSISEYLSERFDPNHSLDIRVDRRWNFENITLITYLDIQNVYNRKNKSDIRWDYEKNKVDDESSIGLLPSIGISLEF